MTKNIYGNAPSVEATAIFTQGVLNFVPGYVIYLVIYVIIGNRCDGIS